VETAIRSAMHQAGAAALTELLQFVAPSPEQRHIPCSCGQQAKYVELRAKTLLTAVGEVKVQRPYYLCSHCHQGQFPEDGELDVCNTEFHPASAVCWPWSVTKPPSRLQGACTSFFKARQKKSWVDSGSGSLPSE